MKSHAHDLNHDLFVNEAESDLVEERVGRERMKTWRQQRQ